MHDSTTPTARGLAQGTPLRHVGRFAAIGALAAGLVTTGVTAVPAVAASDPAYVGDTFSRTVADGWGANPVGTTWTSDTASASYSVGAGSARQTVAVGHTATSTLDTVALTSADVRTGVALDNLAVGTGAYVSAIGRSVAGVGDYRARLRIYCDGKVVLQLSRGTTALKAVTVSGLTYHAGDQLQVRLQVTGTAPTTLQAKVWAAGTAEPASWALSTTDSTAGLQTAGAVGLSTYLSGTATQPVVASFDTLTVNEGTPNTLPTAKVTAKADNLTLAVDGSTSADADGALQSYSWTFGDGSSGSGPIAAHTYAKAGTYTVTLTMVDDRGGSATTTTSVTVTAPNVLPTASFTSSTTDLTARLDATASADPDGRVTGYAWTFGDGTTGTGPTTSHAYGKAGSYTVGLTVTDDRGGTSTTTRTVVAAAPNVAPTAAFTATVADLTASVDASGSSDPDGRIGSLTWNFGDGVTASGTTAQHTYAAAGTYTVTLTVTDDRGATAVTTRQVTAAAPNVAPTAAFSTVVTDLAASLDAGDSADPDGTVAAYTWNYGDGTTGTGETTDHEYAAAGTYTVSLTVTDDRCGVGTTSNIVSVSAPSAVPDASNTGVPAGTKLTVYSGDMTITTAGTVIDSMDIRGLVVIKAPNVVIKNSIIRGRAVTGNIGLITNGSDTNSFTLIDSELAASNPSPYINGIIGRNFTVIRSNIHDVVDQVHITGSNVRIESSWLHGNLHFDVDPNHNGGPSHDDNVQIQAGDNIQIVGNTMSGSHNAGVQVTQDTGVVTNLVFQGNNADNGACTINIAQGSRGPVVGTKVSDNVFGRNTTLANCAVIAKTTTVVAMSNNVYTDGVAVTVRKG